MLLGWQNFKGLWETQQNTDIMAKLDELLESNQKFWISHAAIIIHLDNLETQVNGEQSNENNCINRDRPSRYHGLERGNNECIEDIEDEHQYDDIIRSQSRCPYLRWYIWLPAFLWFVCRYEPFLLVHDVWSPQIKLTKIKLQGSAKVY